LLLALSPADGAAPVRQVKDILQHQDTDHLADRLVRPAIVPVEELREPILVNQLQGRASKLVRPALMQASPFGLIQSVTRATVVPTFCAARSWSS
jgi:hypothetical protein